MNAPTDQFTTAFGIVVTSEGGFTANPSDRGDWSGGQIGVGQLNGTNFGISAASYPTLDIKSLTLDDAEAIYLRDYWLKHSCDKLAWPVSLVLFDGEVNSGGEGADALQGALGVTVDGAIGPVTIAAAARQDPVELACRMCVLRISYYRSLSDFGQFGMGWLKRLFSTMFAAGLAQGNGA